MAELIRGLSFEHENCHKAGPTNCLTATKRLVKSTCCSQTVPYWLSEEGCGSTEFSCMVHQKRGAVCIYIYCIYDVTCELMGVISACFYPLTTSAASSDHHFPYTSNSSSDGFGVEGSDQSKAHRFGPILGYQWCLPITSSGKCSLQIACVHRICYCEKPAFSKLFHVGVLSNQWSLLQTILDAHKPSTEEHIGRSSLLLFSAKLIIKDKQDHCK